MDIIRFENPPLSLRIKVLFIKKHDEVRYNISADGTDAGTIIIRNGGYAIFSNNYQFTKSDIEFLVESVKNLG